MTIGLLFKELSAHDMSIILLPDDNLSKYQWIFTKLAMCINIAQICFGKANGQIKSIVVRVISQGQDSGGVLLFHVFVCHFYQGYCT